jgi:hypothetical protein
MFKLRIALLFAIIPAACESDGSMLTSPKLDGRSSAAVVSNIDMKLDVTGTFWNACAPGGEYVDVAGALHFRVQFRTDPATGVFRITIHQNHQGISGIGQVSGTKYQMMETFNVVQILSPGPESDVTQHIKMQMTSQGRADNSEFHAIYSVHFDPVNGMTFTQKKLSIECRG